MKKVLLSALALLSLAGIGTAQNLPSYVPANGLVGWWPFNGNANDESGNGNNGTVNGAILATDRFGNANAAYKLITQTSINVDNNPSLQITQNISISFWVYLFADGETLIRKGFDYGTDIGDSLAIQTGSYLIFFPPNLFSANSLALQAWNHVVVTKDGSSRSVFVNGFLNSTAIDGQNYNVSNNPLTFGSWNNEIIDAKLDDIAIYNRALTPQEITGLYQGGSTTASCLDLPSNLQQGLVGYWPFCGNANDESGNGNNGTVNGAILTEDRFGNAGSAYSFDGVDDIINTSFSGINGRKSRTISFWYNPGSLETGNSKTMIGYGETSSGDQCGKRFDCTLFQNGGPSIDLAYSYVTYNYPNTIGNWHHYIVSYDSTLGFSPTNIKMYIDGVIQTNILSSSLTCEINTGNLVPVSFGGPYLVTTGHNFNGSLDDIAIWNRALTPQEITQLYNQGICKTSITVTDTLLIHTGINSYNPVAYQNTVKVWPNPGNQEITLDAGNLASMAGWKYKVANGLGQMVVNETAINQQQTNIDLSTWGGNGIYYLHLINPQGIAVEIKKIVLAP